MKVYEVWTRDEWIVTIILLILFPPMGIAALLRKWSGESVWH
jgi:hypothetical protein